MVLLYEQRFVAAGRLSQPGRPCPSGREDDTVAVRTSLSGVPEYNRQVREPHSRSDDWTGNVDTVLRVLTRSWAAGGLLFRYRSRVT